MLFDTTDTITAISTAPGYSPRGIVRLSGDLTFSTLSKLWLDQQDRPLTQQAFDSLEYWQAHKGRLLIAPSISVTGTLTLFKAPASYTAQDMAELHLPGSARLLDMVLARLTSYENIRLAQAGEFTARAFLNGRIDLTEAEAVAEVIHAGGDAQLRAAENLLSGALHLKCQTYAARIAGVLARIEAGIDFSDQEDVSFIEIDQLRLEVSQLTCELQNLVNDSASWQDLHHLPRVVLIGLPNAGKSSLINALTGLDRSIVCAIAGTTRDVISAPVSLPLGECMLYDTPGIGSVADPLGQYSQQNALEVIKSADLLILLWEPADSTELPALLNIIQKYYQKNIISVASKKDIQPDTDIITLADRQHIPRPRTFISARTGENLDTLKQLICDHLHFGSDQSSSEAIALTRRQATALQASIDSLEHLNSILNQESDSNYYDEIIALHLREALDHIGTISGQIVSDEVLGLIFSQFCIGK